MATPSIGTTISEGYSRGGQRIGEIVSAAIVPLLVMGAIAAGISIAQGQVIDTSDIEVSFGSATIEIKGGVSRGDIIIYQLLGALSTFLTFVIGTGLVAAISGALHRERHHGTLELPTAGQSIGAVHRNVQLLTPKVWLLGALQIVGAVLTAFNRNLGGIIGFVAAIFLIYVSIKWIYATVIAGSGEATHDAAYARSEEAVKGSWWATLGTWIVVGIAIGAPAFIASIIVAAILGSIVGVLGVFAAIVVLMLGVQVFGSAAFESAWHQVEAKLGADDQQPPATPEIAPETSTPPASPNSGTDPHSGPFV